MTVTNDEAVTAPSGEQFEISAGEQHATIVAVGGGVRTYRVGARDVLQPYPVDAMCDGAHGAMLIPWPNRLGDGRYRFDGTDYQVALTEPQKHNAIHGFLHWRPWQPIHRAVDRVVMAATLYPLQGYPFTLDVQVDYRLDEPGLTVTTTATNIGDRACPYGCGHHPYLSPGAGLIDECTLQLAADTRIRTDPDRQLPTGIEPVEGTSFDFRTPRVLGDLQIDYAFTDLACDPAGWAWIRLAGPDGATAQLWVDGTYPIVEIYTAATCPGRSDAIRRRGFCPISRRPTAPSYSRRMQIREHVESDKPAIILHPSGTVVTFAELEARANRMAHFLRNAGLTEGDTIAVLMENNEHIHAMMWAARRSGLYYALINTHLTPTEAAYIVDNSGAKAIIGSRAMRKVCEGIAEHLPNGLPDVLLIADDDLDGWQRYPECVADQPDTPITDEFEGDLLQYSSGTTGRPKGIRRDLPHVGPAEAPNMLMALLTAIGLSRDAVYLSPAPLYHTAPAFWSMATQSLGGTIVVMEKFDAESALDAIGRYRVTHGQFVPAMFVRMLKMPEAVRNSYDMSSLQRVVHAAAPCPVDIKKQMIDWWGPIVDEYYASSEAIGAAFIRAEDWLEHPGSVGKPLVGIPHILDDDGVELPTGEPGAIYYEGGFSFEYLKDEAKTAEARDSHGWATVGDIGYLDADGYLFLTDRRHHMIISGGVNIYPQEAEDLLITHPKVLDAAVFGIPDESMGQSVKGAVQTVDAADATEEFAEELLVWLRERLAHFKCPRSISFEAQLPRTDTGKLYKQELVKKYSQPAP